MESQFKLVKINNIETKFHHINAALPEQIAMQFPEHLEEIHEDLKQEILAISAKSTQEMLTEAIGTFTLDINEKPTKLLKRIQHKVK